MTNIKLVIEYDGSAYAGWQKQKNALTIQEVLEDALCKVTGQAVALIGAGRTDSGVHAVGQVANFHTPCGFPAEKYSYILNTLVPYDIRIRSSIRVPDNFHARFCVTGKRYVYSIYNHIHGTALYRNTFYHVRQTLDVPAMEKAAFYLLGTHDFKAFQATGSPITNCVRTIYAAFFQVDGYGIDFTIEGNGFLYHMVRIIMGTLLLIGKGKLAAQDMQKIIATQKREEAGPTVPSHGLCLSEVLYR